MPSLQQRRVSNRDARIPRPLSKPFSIRSVRIDETFRSSIWDSSDILTFNLNDKYTKKSGPSLIKNLVIIIVDESRRCQLKAMRLSGITLRDRYYLTRIQRTSYTLQWKALVYRDHEFICVGFHHVT